jgi:hypothetical protein
MIGEKFGGCGNILVAAAKKIIIVIKLIFKLSFFIKF